VGDDRTPEDAAATADLAETPAASPSAHAAPSAVRRVSAIWRRHVLVYTRSFWTNATPAVLEPLFMLASVGLGVGAYVAKDFNGLPYAEYMAPGILATASLFTAAFESTYGVFVRLKFESAYDAILASPATVRDVVVSELLWAASKGLLYATIVGAVLLACGYVRTPWALAIPALGFANGLATAGLGLLTTSRVKSIDTLQLFFTLIVNPMMLLSGFLFPVGALPSPAAEIAQSLPLFHAVESFRLVCHGPAHVSESWAWACPLLLLAWAVVLAFLGGREFEKRMLRER
jgi:lipooligosaccharide transport system permease protein